MIQFSSIQLLSHVQLFVTSWTAVHQASLSITNSRSLLKLMSVQSVMPSNHLIFYCPLLLLPSVFPSIRVFSNESVRHIRWPKYWSFSFSISPSNEYSGLISFRVDWFDLFAVQRTVKSLLQHYHSKASWMESRILHLKKHMFKHQNSTCFSSVQSLSRVRLFVTPWIAARQASLSITNSQSLLTLMSIKLVMPSNHFILRPLLLLSIFPSIRDRKSTRLNSSHRHTSRMPSSAWSRD